MSPSRLVKQFIIRDRLNLQGQELFDEGHLTWKDVRTWAWQRPGSRFWQYEVFVRRISGHRWKRTYPLLRSMSTTKTKRSIIYSHSASSK